MRSISEIQAELTAAKKEAIVGHDTIVALQKRVTELTGKFGESGIIRRLEEELAKAKCTEADAKLPRVQVENTFGARSERVLTRITAQRIYFRQVGSIESETYCDKLTGKGPWFQIAADELARVKGVGSV